MPRSDMTAEMIGKSFLSDIFNLSPLPRVPEQDCQRQEREGMDNRICDE